MFWGKLPDDPTSELQDLYFNPMIQQFRRGPPGVVRGGIIAEETGLGKTLISLALILKHPAPELPASGSLTSEFDIEGVPSKLDKPTLMGNDKTGSILSRGTLVIVSEKFQ